MPTIDQLSSTSTVNAGDKLPVYVQGNGDARSATMSTILDFVEANFASPDFVTQIFAPSSSGTTIQLATQTKNLWAIINPTGAFAELDLTLPPVIPADGAQVLVTCTNSIALLTVDGSPTGSVVVGAPTALGVGGFFSLRYNKLQNKWYTTSQSLGGISTVFSSITLTDPLSTIKDVNGRVILALAPSYVGAGTGGTNFIFLANDDETAGPSLAIGAAGVSSNVALTIRAKGTGVVDIGLGATVGSSGNVIVSTNAINTGTIAIVTQSGTRAQMLTFLAAASNPVGFRGVVTDSNTPVTGNFGATFFGGGPNVVPVYYDGASLRIG